MNAITEISSGRRPLPLALGEHLAAFGPASARRRHGRSTPPPARCPGPPASPTGAWAEAGPGRRRWRPTWRDLIRRMPTGGWSIGPDTARVLATLFDAVRPRLVLELGSGSSTVLFAALCARMDEGARVVSLDETARRSPRAPADGAERPRPVAAGDHRRRTGRAADDRRLDRSDVSPVQRRRGMHSTGGAPILSSSTARPMALASAATAASARSRLRAHGGERRRGVRRRRRATAARPRDRPPLGEPFLRRHRGHHPARPRPRRRPASAGVAVGRAPPPRPSSRAFTDRAWQGCRLVAGPGSPLRRNCYHSQSRLEE